jgi:hypothetical protein
MLLKLQFIKHFRSDCGREKVALICYDSQHCKHNRPLVNTKLGDLDGLPRAKMLHMVSSTNKNKTSTELDLRTSLKKAGERNMSHRCHSLFILGFPKLTATTSVHCGIKVKQPLYRPGEALMVPGGCGSQISRQLAHEGGIYSWYSLLLEAESTPVPQCDYVNEKCQ